MKSRLSFSIDMHNEHFLHNHTIIRMNKSQHICSLQVDRDLASLSACLWLLIPAFCGLWSHLHISRFLKDEDGAGCHCWQFYLRPWYIAGTVYVCWFMHGVSSYTSMWFRWDSTCSMCLKGFWLWIKHNFHSKQYFLESIRNLVTNLYKLCIELLFGYFKQILLY